MILKIYYNKRLERFIRAILRCNKLRHRKQYFQNNKSAPEIPCTISLYEFLDDYKQRFEES